MRKDSYHIEMDDLTRFPLEKSGDCKNWEDAPHDELNALLDKVDEERGEEFPRCCTGGKFFQAGRFLLSHPSPILTRPALCPINSRSS